MMLVNSGLWEWFLVFWYLALGCCRQENIYVIAETLIKDVGRDVDSGLAG